MSDDFGQHSDLTDRLRALGTQPIEAPLASSHLTALVAVPVRATSIRHKVQVAAALLVGLMIGGTTLASAGALGNGAEKAVDRAAEVAIAKVKGDDVDGPGKANKPAKNKAPKAAKVGGEGSDRSTPVTPMPCPSDVKNHGQYVSSHPKGNRSLVAQSDCGKKAGDDTEATETEKRQGPPPEDKVVVPAPDKGQSESHKPRSTPAGPKEGNGETGVENRDDAPGIADDGS